MSDNSHKDAESWYVMCHPNPRQIEVLLRKESEGAFCTDGGRPTPFKFYVPYLYMPVAETPSPSTYTRELRSDFHSFVFIQASAGRVNEIVTSDWNRRGRLHIFHYRDHEGKNVTVSDTEIRSLMSTFRDQTLRFFIGQPIDEFSAGDKVILNIASWAGQEGVVTDIRLRKGRLTMTIGMNIFGRTKSINFTDLRTGDVTFKDPARAGLLSANPIDRLEEEIVDLLSHWAVRATSYAESDKVRLHRLSMFDKLYMDMDDTDYSRLLSLRLICAVLRQNKKRREVLQQEAERRLTGREQPETDDEAYLMTALFIATRQARYRNAVKVYRTAHPDCPDILRRFHSIVKKLKAKPVK